MVSNETHLSNSRPFEIVGRGNTKQNMVSCVRQVQNVRQKNDMPEKGNVRHKINICAESSNIKMSTPRYVRQKLKNN